METLLSNKELFKLVHIIKSARNIVVCGHHSPDGDALGSALAWANYLRGIGKNVQVIMPNLFPDFLKWMPGAEDVLFFNRQTDRCKHSIENAHLICCLDFNELGRLHEMSECVIHSKAEKIIIDHHLEPAREGFALTLSYPSFCATSEIIFRLICDLGAYDELSKNSATALYTGMMTDTGGFTYNSTRPEIYEAISMLLAKGIDKDKIYRNVNNNYSEGRLRLMGYLLHEKLHFFRGNRASLFTLNREEMARFGFKRGDTEGLVNIPLQVKGMRLSISLREDTEKDVIRVSLRSVDDFPCNKMAEKFFNGGGHLNASGGELPFPMEEAVKAVEKAIEEFSDML